MAFFAKTAQRAGPYGSRAQLLLRTRSRGIASAAGVQVLPSHHFSSEQVSSQQNSRRDAIRNAKPFSSFLTDTFQRQHDYLRISITEKCNLRCLYCMPEEGVPQSPPPDLLTSPEIFLLSSTFVSQGVTKIRLTGGEPTVRRDILPLMHQIGSLRSKGLRELCLTTNGISLHRKLDSMVEAGLTGVNLSLDTLDPWQFQIMTRRKGFEAVMKSIESILEMNKLGAGIKLKINCVVMRGMNDQEIIPFVELGREQDLEVRFIEYMPFDGNKWSEGKMLPYQEMLDIIRAKYPSLRKVQDHKNDTSKTYEIPGFVGRMGFITSMTHNFCGTCNRLRITSDGNLKVCLFGNDEVSLRDILRKSNSGRPIDEQALEALKNIELGRQQGMVSAAGPLGGTMHERELLEVIGLAVKGKKEKHAGIGELENMKNRPMILIDKAPRYHPSCLQLKTPSRPRQTIPTHLLNTSHLIQHVRCYSSNTSVTSPEGCLNRSDLLNSNPPKIQVQPRTALIRRLAFKGPLDHPQSEPISIAYNNKIAKLKNPETPKVAKILPTVKGYTGTPWPGRRNESFHKDTLLITDKEAARVEKSESWGPSWAEIYLKNIEELKAAKLAYKNSVRELVTRQDLSSREGSELVDQLLKKATDAYAAAQFSREQVEQQKPMPVATAKLLKTQPLRPVIDLPRLAQAILEDEKELAKGLDRKEIGNGDPTLLIHKSRRVTQVTASNLSGFRYPIGEEKGKPIGTDRNDLETGGEIPPYKIARTRRSNLPYRNPSQLVQGSTSSVADTQTPALAEAEGTKLQKQGLEKGNRALMMHNPDSGSTPPRKPKTIYVKLNDPNAIVPQPLDKRWTVVSRKLLSTGKVVLWKYFPEHFGPNGEVLKPFHPVVERSISSSPLSRFRIVETWPSHALPPSKQGPIPGTKKVSLRRSTGENKQLKSILDAQPLPEQGTVDSRSFILNGSPLMATTKTTSTTSKRDLSSRSFSTSAVVAHPKLTHVTPSGSAHMVDIAAKDVTSRTAIAVCNINFSNSEVLPLIRANQMKKGDVLGVARIAGIMAAKKTPDIIPLCHPIAITNASVELEIHEPKIAHDKSADGYGGIEITASVSCDGKTGVEMEALTACSAAALTVYDMCKAVDKEMRIENLRVVRKSGGRSGDFAEKRLEVN